MLSSQHREAYLSFDGKRPTLLAYYEENPERFGMEFDDVVSYLGVERSKLAFIAPPKDLDGEISINSGIFYKAVRDGFILDTLGQMKADPELNITLPPEIPLIVDMFLPSSKALTYQTRDCGVLVFDRRLPGIIINLVYALTNTFFNNGSQVLGDSFKNCLLGDVDSIIADLYKNPTKAWQLNTAMFSMLTNDEILCTTGMFPNEDVYTEVSCIADIIIHFFATHESVHLGFGHLSKQTTLLKNYYEKK